jgi:hypothetical protein
VQIREVTSNGNKTVEAKKNVRMSSENTVGNVVLYNVHDRYPRMVVSDPENGMQKDYDDNKESVVDGGLGVTVYMSVHGL